jgi:hypothetical protein
MKLSDRELHLKGRLLRIGHLEGDKYEKLADPASALDELRASGVGIDLFTFMQVMPHTSRECDYPMEWDNLAVLRVSTFDHWWTKQINNKTRNMVRRAEKSGVAVREVPFDAALVRGIWTIYNEVPMRQGKRFAHYGKDLESVHQMSATFPNQSTFIGAFLGEQLIGFVKLVSDREGQQASLMHIMALHQCRDKAPTNALIAQAVKSCADRGFQYLAYSNFAYGKKQRDGLSDFKEYNGFERVELPRYYVPLTLVGRAALRLRLHRGLADRIPESIQTRLRSLRSAMYARSLPGHKQATLGSQGHS